MAANQRVGSRSKNVAAPRRHAFKPAAASGCAATRSAGCDCAPRGVLNSSSPPPPGSRHPYLASCITEAFCRFTLHCVLGVESRRAAGRGGAAAEAVRHACTAPLSMQHQGGRGVVMYIQAGALNRSYTVRNGKRHGNGVLHWPLAGARYALQAALGQTRCVLCNARKVRRDRGEQGRRADAQNIREGRGAGDAPLDRKGRVTPHQTGNTPSLTRAPSCAAPRAPPRPPRRCRAPRR